MVYREETTSGDPFLRKPLVLTTLPRDDRLQERGEVRKDPRHFPRRRTVNKDDPG